MANYSVFFTGENHTFATLNSKTEFKLLIYLHEKFGVNHFLFEQGPALGYIINKITLEDNLDYRFYLQDRFYDPFYTLVNNIRKYNDKTTDSLKIRTHGIDIERFPAFAIYALDKIVDSLPITGETGRIYESIKALGSSEFIDGTPDDIYNSGGTRFNLNGDVIDAWSTFNTIIYDTERLKDTLALELGDDYTTFMEIVKSVEKGHQWYHEERDGDLTGPITRERFMIDQFQQISKRYDNAKFYGQFGRCHLHSNKKAKRCYSYDMASVVKRIGESNDSLYYQKVMTIPILYKMADGYDKEVIKNLYLPPELTTKNSAYIVDLEYLKGDNPMIGFSNSLKYVIINNYPKDGYEEMYAFEYNLEEFHLGAFVGNRYLNRLSNLNNTLLKVNSNEFSSTQQFYTFAFDYVDVRKSGLHLSYSFIPEVSNGDRFALKASYFTFGNSFPIGNRFFSGQFWTALFLWPFLFKRGNR